MVGKPIDPTYEELLLLREKRRVAKRLAMQKYREKMGAQYKEYQHKIYSRRKNATQQALPESK